MAIQANKEREKDTLDNILDPLPYESLVASYPVWAAMFACGVVRKDDKYKSVAAGLFSKMIVRLVY